MTNNIAALTNTVPRVPPSPLATAIVGSVGALRAIDWYEAPGAIALVVVYANMCTCGPKAVPLGTMAVSGARVTSALSVAR